MAGQCPPPALQGAGCGGTGRGARTAPGPCTAGTRCVTTDSRVQQCTWSVAGALRPAGRRGPALPGPTGLASPAWRHAAPCTRPLGLPVVSSAHAADLCRRGSPFIPRSLPAVRGHCPAPRGHLQHGHAPSPRPAGGSPAPLQPPAGEVCSQPSGVPRGPCQRTHPSSPPGSSHQAREPVLGVNSATPPPAPHSTRRPGQRQPLASMCKHLPYSWVVSWCVPSAGPRC